MPSTVGRCCDPALPRHCRDATDVVSPWTVTVINSAYRNLVDSFNVDVTIAVQRVIQGTVVAGTVPSNGQSSVPITLIVEADAGLHGALLLDLPDHGTKWLLPPGHADPAAANICLLYLQALTFRHSQSFRTAASASWSMWVAPPSPLQQAVVMAVQRPLRSPCGCWGPRSLA